MILKLFDTIFLEFDIESNVNIEKLRGNVQSKINTHRLNDELYTMKHIHGKGQSDIQCK
jgi:hypothetical protein